MPHQHADDIWTPLKSSKGYCTIYQRLDLLQDFHSDISLVPCHLHFNWMIMCVMCAPENYLKSFSEILISIFALQCQYK